MNCERYFIYDCTFCYSYRSLESAETYLVVMNVGSEDEHVDLSSWPTADNEEPWVVHTPSVNSQYSIGWGAINDEVTF